MAKNPFPKGSRVRLRFCAAQDCNCHGKYINHEEGIVRSALGRLLRVELAPYEGLMAREAYFRKYTAAGHLERLDKPAMRIKVVACDKSKEA